MNSPIITIITPTFNREKYITQAIDSVYSQDYEPVEHIIVDGGSMDSTLDLVTRYPQVSMICEPDEGVYDALNKGIRLARGEIIGLLNSDDYYGPESFQLVSEKFHQSPDKLAVLGGARVFRENESGGEDTLLNYAPYSTKEFLREVIFGVPRINAWFFRRELFDKFGLFDLSYKIASDRDFMIRLALSQVPYSTVSQTLIHYRYHSGSLTFDSSYQAAKAVMVENRRLARDRGRKASTPFERKLFSSWYRILTIDQTLFSLQARDFRAAVQCARNGIRHDPAWPGRFILAVLKSGIRRGKNALKAI